VVDLFQLFVLVVGAHRVVGLAVGEDDVDVAVFVREHQVRSGVVERERGWLFMANKHGVSLIARVEIRKNSHLFTIVPSPDALVRGFVGLGEEPDRLVVAGGGEEAS
jgi:hypothetical protein